MKQLKSWKVGTFWKFWKSVKEVEEGSRRLNKVEEG